MGHTWKNGSHLEKLVTFGKMGHNWKNCTHLEKRVTLGKMGHTRKKWITLEKRVTLEKLGHTWKSGSHLEKGVTLGVTLGKKVTLGKMVHPCKHRNARRARVIFLCEVSERRAFMELFTVMIWLIWQVFWLRCTARKKLGIYDVHSMLHRSW